MKKIVILGCENSHADTFLDIIKNDTAYSDVEVLGVYSDEPDSAETLKEKFGVYVMSSYDEFAGQVDGGEIMTVEGLSETEIGSILQRCFIENGAVQCGFCTPGFVLETKSLLAENPHPTREEIREGLSGHVCRCGVYQGVEHAVEKVSKTISEEGK